MNGVITPGVSAGSNHVGAREMWTAYVTSPSGAAETGEHGQAARSAASAVAIGSRRDTAVALLAQPDGVELLVQEVARHERPAPDLGEMRHDPVPLEPHDEVNLIVVEPLLELAQEPP